MLVYWLMLGYSFCAGVRAGMIVVDPCRLLNMETKKQLTLCRVFDQGFYCRTDSSQCSLSFRVDQYPHLASNPALPRMIRVYQFGYFTHGEYELTFGQRNDTHRSAVLTKPTKFHAFTVAEQHGARNASLGSGISESALQVNRGLPQSLQGASS